MGAYALPAALGMMASGTVTSAVGSYRQGEADRKAAKFNAEMIRREVSAQQAQMAAAQRRQRAANITRIAKSGVRVSGSPLAVLESNEYEAQRQQDYMASAGDMQRELLRMRGRNARAAGRMGVASNVLSGAGQLGTLAVKHYA